MQVLKSRTDIEVPGIQDIPGRMEVSCMGTHHMPYTCTFSNMLQNLPSGS